jgi:hypothetical protein
VSRPERGAYGNARGKAPKTKRRAARLAEPRVAAALEEARQHQAIIDALAAAESQPAGRPKLVYEKPEEREAVETPADHDLKAEYHAPGRVAVKEKTKLAVKWNVKDVYLLIEQGYHPDYICKRTGYDAETVAAVIEDILSQPEEDEGGEGDAEEQD